jgi:hypothetical protein
MMPAQIAYSIYLIKDNKKRLIIATSFVIVIALWLFYDLFFGNLGYINLIRNFDYGFNKPITVGYSLSIELGATFIRSNIHFLYALIKWYSLGTSISALLYLSLFLLGLIILVKENIKFAILNILWIVIPLLIFFTVRLDHWFEEKYFLFMLPAYLLLVAIGACTFYEILITKFYKVTFVLFVIILAIYGNLHRTTYGFNFNNMPIYSWLTVYNYLSANFKSTDLIITRKYDSEFLKYYNETYEGNLKIFEDQEILGTDLLTRLNSEYPNSRLIYISIPDIHTLFIFPLVNHKKIITLGGFNIEEINLKSRNLAPPLHFC